MDATATPQVSVNPSSVVRSTPVVTQPTPVVVSSTPEPVIKPTARRSHTFFRLSQLGDYVQAWGGILFFAVLGIALWRADAHFTLWFFGGWMPSIMERLSYTQWLIPVLLTLGQLYFFVGPAKLKLLHAVRKVAAENPDHETSYRKYLKLRKRFMRHTIGFLAVSIINIGTSAQGMYEWAAGRTINLFGGFTLPQPGTPLRILCFVLGIILAFGAEKAFKAAWDEYKDR